ncbi:MAG: hypothetical protein AAGA48_31405 [Myxococcota bacterium]
MDWRIAAAAGWLVGLLMGAVTLVLSAAEDVPCEARVAKLTADLRELGGVPIPWPKADHGPFAPHALRAWLDASPTLFEGFATVEGLYCEEYPCLLALLYHPEVGFDDNVLDAVFEELTEHTSGQLILQSDTYNGPRGTIAILPVIPYETISDVGLFARIKVRGTKLLNRKPPSGKAIGDEGLKPPREASP